MFSQSTGRFNETCGWAGLLTASGTFARFAAILLASSLLSISLPHVDLCSSSK